MALSEKNTEGGTFAKLNRRWFSPLTLAVAFATALFAFATHAQMAGGRQFLHGHVPEAVTRLHLQPLGHLPATNQLHLAISLPLRNQAALDKLLSEIYDPASTNYHRYLTPEQFAAQFGPTEQDYQALVTFARTNGLTVTGTYPNRALLDVNGSAADVERVFHVTLRTYQHPTENRTFYAPDTEPSVDLNVPILRVNGLDDFSKPRPAGSLKKNHPRNESSGVPPANGSGPSGSYIGNDFRATYAPGATANGVTLNGGGQTVGLLEFDGFYSNDIASYETLAGIGPVSIQTNLLDGATGSPGAGNEEVALDIEMVIAMAPGVSKVIVYEAPNSSAYNLDLLTRMATDNLAKQLSCSWIIGDNPSYDTEYKQMAAQGQTFFQSSGDDGAYYPGIGQWADSTNITIVGGTTLLATNPVSETAWNWYITSPGFTNSTGGGTNINGVPIPAYQQGLNMTTNLGSTTLRNVPDVALTADGIFIVADNGTQITSEGGTSCAAPLWAGFCALVNQQAALVLKPTVGFLNPAIYAIGKGPNYALDFHDVTAGNNTNAAIHNKYTAIPGYDLCTGWGTPNGQNLINALLPPDALVVVPATGFSAGGPAGGPFNPGSQVYFLTNTGATSLNWSLINTSAWLNASPSFGTLAAGASNSTTISLNTAATNTLAVGNYTATLKLTNWNTHVVQNLQFSMQALQPLVVSPAGGFTSAGGVGGPFAPNAGNFSVTNSGAAAMTWSLMNTSAWLNASSTNGTLIFGAATNFTISLKSTATNLATGTYNATVWFTNQSRGGAQSRMFTLLVNQPLVQNNGFETGDFTSWTLTGASNYMTVVSGNAQFVHSGTYGAQMGPQGVQSYLSQTVPTLPGQTYLLSMWLDSPNVAGTLTPNEFSVAWNGNTVTDMMNIGKIGWTNLQFFVTAAGTSTVLQFGFRDDPYYLGFDDVSLTPIAQTFFQTATRTNNNFRFSWNATTGLIYQVQYKTNLLQTNWQTLQSITATNTVLNYMDSNAITNSPERFYRLNLQP